VLLNNLKNIKVTELGPDETNYKVYSIWVLRSSQGTLWFPYILMSAQSGISAAPDLIKEFQISSNVRAFLLAIRDDKVEIVKTVTKSGTWEQDFSLLKGQVDAKEASYILYLKDEKYLFFQYIPDSASVKNKMIYASSKNTISKQLGESNFSEYIFCTTLQEISLDGYNQHLLHSQADHPKLIILT
jgi:twinfilin-like protein